MRNLLALVGLVVVVFLIAGAYLDWYRLGRAPGETPGASNLTIKINETKIAADVSQGVEHGRQKLNDVFEKQPLVGPPAPVVTPAVPTTTQRLQTSEVPQVTPAPAVPPSTTSSWFPVAREPNPHTQRTVPQPR